MSCNVSNFLWSLECLVIKSILLLMKKYFLIGLGLIGSFSLFAKEMNSYISLQPIVIDAPKNEITAVITKDTSEKRIERFSFFF